MQLETVHPLPEVRKAMRFASNRPLVAACKRYGIPVMQLSRRRKALRHADYELLLSRAAAGVKR